jgi:CRP/FNR family transcriptional regulator, cyclic AMP receptor protein
MTMQSRIEMLQQMAVFGAIRTDTLELLLEHARKVAVKAGDYFFREGDPGDSMYVLEAGHVQVLKQGDEAEPRLLREFVAGDCFGEMAVMDLAPRSASVRAVEDSSAIEIDMACLRRVYQDDMQQFLLIQMNIGRELSRRLRRADEQLFRHL